MSLEGFTTHDFLQAAYRAAVHSPDKSNQNGALVYQPEMMDCGVGCNEFQLDYTEEVKEALLADRDEKLKYIEHAERNAIYDAVCQGYFIPGSTLFCPWAACHDCARAVIGCGIEKVVVHKQRMALTPERWVASIEAAMNLMSQAGTIIEEFDGPVGGTKPIICNGQLWSPETLEFV